MPQKVCPQCEAAVPVRRTCERFSHVFRSKRKAECNLCGKTMKPLRKLCEEKKTCMESMRESETIEQTAEKTAKKTRMGSFELCSIIMMSCETLLI